MHVMCNIKLAVKQNILRCGDGGFELVSKTRHLQMYLQFMNNMCDGGGHYDYNEVAAGICNPKH